MARQLTKQQRTALYVGLGAVAVVLVVLAIVAFLPKGSEDSVPAAHVQPTDDVSTTVATTASKARTTKQVQVPSDTTPTSTETSVSTTTVETSASQLPHLQPEQALPPTPIQGLNFLIDGSTWVPMDPSESMDGGMNRMTKVNLMPAKPGPNCDPATSTRLCQGFVVVDADQAPFYGEDPDKCLTIGGSNDPQYKFARKLGDKTIDGMVVERFEMTRCDAPGVSNVWKFALPNSGSTKVMVFEVGNDTTKPLPGLEALLDKVTVASAG